MQTKDDPSSAGPVIGNENVDGGVGLDNLLTRLEAVELKAAQYSSVPSEFNAEGNSAVEDEVIALRRELETLRAKPQDWNEHQPHQSRNRLHTTTASFPNTTTARNFDCSARGKVAHLTIRRNPECTQ